MPFYSDEDEGTPCPIRLYSPKSDLLSRQRRDRTTLGRITAFPLIAGDENDKTVEIELTTVLPNISSFGSRNRRKTILNEPPRRPGQSRNKGEQRAVHRESREEVLEDEVYEQEEKGREENGGQEEEEEEDEDIFRLPSPPPLQTPLEQPATSFEEEEEGEEEEDNSPGYAAALQPQPTQFHQARRQTSGAGLSQHPKRPVTGLTGGVRSGRRLSAWVEAKVQEKRRERMAAQQIQADNLPAPQVPTATQQHYDGGNRTSAPESYVGVNMYTSPDDVELARSYLNAPPKRGISRPTERVQGLSKTVGRGKENMLPERDSRQEERKPIHITVPSQKALEHGNSNGGRRDNKRPASTEIGAHKKSKLSTESKVPLKPAASSVSGIYDDEEQPASKKRPSSPQPRFVSESDLEEEDSYVGKFDILTRTSNTSNRSWNQSPPRNAKLRLIKRRKISTEEGDGDDAEGELNPAQAAMAQQLAARKQKEKVYKDGPIRPTLVSSAEALNASNPVLSDDLVQVRMYEDSWLSMLEASVMQLVNAIFSQYEASRASTIETHLQLRREMINLYSALPSVHKRIQASLAFGALVVPKGVVAKSSAVKNWGEDIGVKKKFMDLFMNTYDVEILGIALEVIIGRELFGKTGTRLSDAQIIKEGTYILAMQEKDKIKLVERFLEKFLVNCEDAYLNPPRSRQSTARIVGALGIVGTKGAAMGRSLAVDDDWGSVAWGLRKTILRALMLILLLDKTKKGDKDLLGSRCLFRKNSQHKSSISILHALSRLLLPSLGDVVRPLSLMGYSVEHIQHPLEEYSYPVENLAVDMRDGVRLVRLVELLLYPTEVQTSTKTGIWPLSKELKFPAISRVHKSTNVSIALEALEDAGGNENGVKAEDIVDGYREKTVGLLWGVVGRWGLEMGVGGLVDWSELRKEIRRMKKSKIRAEGGDPRLLSDEDEDDDEERGYVALLKSWAKCIAEKKGLEVQNMTTSFADGKVFEAIVEEYEGYFPKKATEPQGSRLEMRLKELGCSSFFAGLFGDKQRTGKVFDRDFVIGGLAFLCSRLLQWSIRERAAISIQRAFRAWRFCQVAHIRIHFLILAHECAAFIQAKERAINAAIVIQRAFRNQLRAKLNRLLSAVTGIQCTVRGYLIRAEIKAQFEATLKIQRWWRELREKWFRQRTGVLLENVTQLQAVARGFLTRWRVDNVYYAVAIVGTEYGRLLKGRRVRQRFLEQRNAAVTIQRWYRSVKETLDVREEFLNNRSSVVGLQAIIRGKLMRDDYNRKLHAVMILQREFRSCLVITRARYSFLKVKWAIMNLQQAWRKRRWLVRMRKMLRDVVIIQQAWRKRRWLVRMRKMLRDVVIIQSLWRGYIARKHWHQSILRLSIVCSEALKAMQSNSGDKEKMLRDVVIISGDEEKMLRDVVIIQSLWRGYAARKAWQHPIPRLRTVRRRVLKAMQSDSGDEETLGSRALKGIMMVKVATGLGRGLLQLDYTTGNSRECAVLLAADEDAIKMLVSHIDAAAKVLPRTTPVPSSRNLGLIFSTFANISLSRKAGEILARRATPGGRGVFAKLFIFMGLASLAKQPAATNELGMSALTTLTNFCSRSQEVRRMLASNWKWLETLSSMAKAERDTGSGKSKKSPEATALGKLRAEKMEELLELLR